MCQKPTYRIAPGPRKRPRRVAGAARFCIGLRFKRPKGARNKISEKFLEALAIHFEVHGETAIDKVYQERPHDYLKIVASVLPKRMELDTAPEKPPSKMTDDELYAAMWKATQQLRDWAWTRN
jgi:hypothetical protein